MKLALDLNSKRLDWKTLIGLYERAAATSLPPNRCIRVLLSRDEPGSGFTLMIDCDADATPGGSGGVIFGWGGYLDGKFVFGQGGGQAISSLDSNRGDVEKFINAPSSKSVEINFRVWPDA